MPKNTFEDRDLTKITEVEEFKEVVNCFRRAYALLPLKDATNFLDLLISKSLEFDDYRSLITLYYSRITLIFGRMDTFPEVLGLYSRMLKLSTDNDYLEGQALTKVVESYIEKFKANQPKSGFSDL